MSAVLHGLWHGLDTTWMLLWESLYGLTLGFLLSAVVQVAIPQQLLRRYATGGLRGIGIAAGFGAISSSCSYGSAAATRSLYRRGADARAAFAFLISSTNMNVAILVMFWVLVGWRFAFAEFFGGIIIIAVVAAGLTLLFPGQALERLRATDPDDQRPRHPDPDPHPGCAPTNPGGTHAAPAGPAGRVTTPGAGAPVLVTGAPVETQDLVCGMAGSAGHRAEHAGRGYLFCSAGCRDSFAADPERFTGERLPDRPSLRSLDTWSEISARAWGDVRMLRTELLAGYLLAGFAEALVPRRSLSHALHAVGAVPVLGYVLLLLLGLAIAVATFVCSMGNVPVAAFLKTAGIPLGANTAYIYGDLLILPLVRIYQRSFPPRLTAAFLGLFVLGASLAGAVMEAVIRVLPSGG